MTDRKPLSPSASGASANEHLEGFELLKAWSRELVDTIEESGLRGNTLGIQAVHLVFHAGQLIEDHEDPSSSHVLTDEQLEEVRLDQAYATSICRILGIDPQEMVASPDSSEA